MLPDSTFDLLESIAKKHGDGDFSSTTESERKVLEQINAAIADGDIELYPMKALLAASNHPYGTIQEYPSGRDRMWCPRSRE